MNKKSSKFAYNPARRTPNLVVECLSALSSVRERKLDYFCGFHVNQEVWGLLDAYVRCRATLGKEFAMIVSIRVASRIANSLPKL
jgi:hypothetical protein